MFKILLPVDFSDGTLKTCSYALNLAAGANKARLVLLHCFLDYLADDAPTVNSTSGFASSEAISDRVIHRNELDAQEELDELYHELLKLSRKNGQHVQLERAFIHGTPQDVIQAQVQRFKPDLIIMMGTKGEPGLAKNLFGTVSSKIALDAQVPVLTLPQEYNGRSLSKVLYATDFDKADVRAIAILQNLLQPFSPAITCVHVSAQNEQQDQEHLEQLQQQLQKNTAATNTRFVLLKKGSVAEALQEFVQKENIDLLALTTRQRSLFDSIIRPSLAKKLVLTSEIPLLVFHNS
ncbi:universal stress protein [Pontibacter silvestris]|uniref:Universal stress protein n=1 Tax=Pontibacter silvestris TaxID=2305183 RepID=A0ABW4X0V9_9BACT|nr:universal stress protein [Pontibacter silvestris]MCC9135645.1 universal stress protein [Pontibacter silvestris]